MQGGSGTPKKLVKILVHKSKRRGTHGSSRQRAGRIRESINEVQLDREACGFHILERASQPGH